MFYLFSFLVTWWYCYDDHLAEWTNTPAVGTVPLWLWLLILIGWLLILIGCWIASARMASKR